MREKPVDDVMKVRRRRRGGDGEACDRACFTVGFSVPLRENEEDPERASAPGEPR